jgi:hypothetical protein
MFVCRVKEVFTGTKHQGGNRLQAIPEEIDKAAAGYVPRIAFNEYDNALKSFLTFMKDQYRSVKVDYGNQQCSIDYRTWTTHFLDVLGKRQIACRIEFTNNDKLYLPSLLAAFTVGLYKIDQNIVPFMQSPFVKMDQTRSITKYSGLTDITQIRVHLISHIFGLLLTLVPEGCGLFHEVFFKGMTAKLAGVENTIIQNTVSRS